MPVQIGHQEHGVEEPLGLLGDCHRRIERFLDALLAVCRGERATPLSLEGRKALERSLDYFRTAAPLHTADEEESLFPLLRASGGDLAEVLGSLEADHRRVEAAQARVDRLATRWLHLERKRLPATEAAELVEHLESLQRIYAQHIRIEDHEIFPAAARILAPEELETIGRQMAERRGISFRGPLERFLEADHTRLDRLLGAAGADPERIRLEPFDEFRAGILRHISIEEKLLLPALIEASHGRRPAVAELLRADHSAIAALLVPPPTPTVLAELRSILERHNSCEEGPGGLYARCDVALGPAAALDLLERIEAHPEVRLKAYRDDPRVQAGLRRSLERSAEAWRRWRDRGSDRAGAQPSR